MPTLPESLSSLSGINGFGTLSALVLIVVARALLPPEERRLVFAPLLFLGLHLVFWTLAQLIQAEEFSRLAQLSSLFLLLASLGRSGFLVLVHAVVARRLAFQLPRIVEDLIQAGIYIGALLLTLHSAGVEPGSLLATSALLTAVLGLSLQDTLGNMFAGLAIQAERPFEVGHWIQFDENERLAGRVVEINWRATRILTLDQVVITVPNGILAKAAIRNFSAPTRVIRYSSYIVAPQDAPPEMVRNTLTAAVSACPGVLVSPEPSVLVDKYSERGVEYWVRYFIDDLERRDVIRGRVNERLWYALSRVRLAVPAPRRRVELSQFSEQSRSNEEAREVAERLHSLLNVGFLSPLSEAQKRTLAQHAERRLYASGERIISQGEVGDDMFIIERGKVEVALEWSGNQTSLAELGPGEFFGEMSLMTGEGRAANVTALDESSLIVIGAQAFHLVIGQNATVLEEISELLASRHNELAAQTSGPLSRDRHTQPDLLLDKIRRFFNRSERPREQS